MPECPPACLTTGMCVQACSGNCGPLCDDETQCPHCGFRVCRRHRADDVVMCEEGDHCVEADCVKACGACAEQLSYEWPA